MLKFVYHELPLQTRLDLINWVNHNTGQLEELVYLTNVELFITLQYGDTKAFIKDLVQNREYLDYFLHTDVALSMTDNKLVVTPINQLMCIIDEHEQLIKENLFDCIVSRGISFAEEEIKEIIKRNEHLEY